MLHGVPDTPTDRVELLDSVAPLPCRHRLGVPPSVQTVVVPKERLRKRGALFEFVVQHIDRSGCILCGSLETYRNGCRPRVGLEHRVQAAMYLLQGSCDDHQFRDSSRKHLVRAGRHTWGQLSHPHRPLRLASARRGEEGNRLSWRWRKWKRICAVSGEMAKD